MTETDLTVVARVVARPDRVEETRALLSSLVAPTRAEPGCRYYAFFQDAERPACFISVERWASPEAAAAHMETSHVRAALAAIGPLLAESPEIRPSRPL